MTPPGRPGRPGSATWPAAWAAACALAVLAPAGGCSFLFVTSPKPIAQRCTTSSAMPALDSFATVLQVFRFGLATQQPSSSYQGGKTSRDTNLLISGTLLAVFASSAGYGFHATNECRKVNEQRPEWDASDGPRRRRVAPVVRRRPPPAMPGGFANTGVPMPEQRPDEATSPPAVESPPLPAPPAAAVNKSPENRSHPWAPPVARPPIPLGTDAGVPPSSIAPPAASATPTVPGPPPPPVAPRAPQHHDQEDPTN